jgi:hypothetical protein
MCTGAWQHLQEPTGSTAALLLLFAAARIAARYRVELGCLPAYHLTCVHMAGACTCWWQYVPHELQAADLVLPGC